jgi:hypothetical protein
MSGSLRREKLVNELLDLREMYNPIGYVTVAGQQIPLDSLVDRPMVTAVFTPEAWEFYAQLEMAMVMAANDSSFADKALPTFERLSRSLMKLAVLLAATRQEPRDSSINVDIHDLQHAARYVQSWGRFSVDLILNVGKTNTLRLLEKVKAIIRNRPGIFKSELMRSTHLSSREMTDVITTLIDRGDISRRSPQSKGRGRTEQYWTIQ